MSELHKSNPHIRKAWFCSLISIVIGFLVFITLLYLAYPVQYIIDRGLSSANIERATGALGQLLLDPALMGRTYLSWFQSNIRTFGYPPILLLLAIFLPFISGLTIFLISGPHSFKPTHLGSAEFAAIADLKKNELFARCGFYLGRFGHPFRGKIVRNWETLSAMIISPPGTGKTVQLISQILGDHPDRGVKVPGPTMIINDPKGEIYAKTAGWRSKKGPVFHIRWNELEGTCFNPLSFGNFKNGRDIIPTRKRLEDELAKIYADPRKAVVGFLIASRELNTWRDLVKSDPGMDSIRKNVTLPETNLVKGLEEGQASQMITDELLDLVVLLQTYYVEMESYVDRLTTVAVPTTEGKAPDHWQINGRAADAGFLLFQMHRYERRLIEAVDPDLVPEPSFGSMLTWLASADIDPDDTEEDVAENDQVASLLDDAIGECRAHGYPARVQEELGALRSKPDKERGSIISTGIGKLNIFKSAAIRARTSRSDITFENLRGIDGRPVTIYFDIPLQDAEAVGIPTGFFLEGSAAYLISQPEKIAKGKGSRPVAYLLDEFWTLPAMESVTQIPALGRGQWVQLLLIGQSFSQIAKKLGKDSLEILKSAIAIRIFYTLNNFQEAKEVSDTIGNKTVAQENVSQARGSMDLKDWGKSNVSKSYQSLPLMRPEELMSLEKLDPQKKRWGQMIIQITGMMNRPIKATPVIWFKDQKLRKRAGYKERDFIDGPGGVLIKNWQPNYANSNKPKVTNTGPQTKESKDSELSLADQIRRGGE